MPRKRPTIIVTKRDIANGKPQECGSCPIALAVKRRFVIRRVSIDGAIMKIAGCEYRTPQRASDFIYDFDGNGQRSRRYIKPFKFKLPEAMAKKPRNR